MGFRTSVLALLFLAAMWLVCPFRTGLALHFDPTAQVTGWDILRIALLLGLGWELFALLALSQHASQSSNESNWDDPLTWESLLPASESGCGVAFGIALIGGGTARAQS